MAKAIQTMPPSIALIEPPQSKMGLVHSIRGAVVTARMPPLSIGDYCEIQAQRGQVEGCEVIGFDQEYVKLALFNDTRGIASGQRVVNSSHSFAIKISSGLLGRVLDPLGNPIDQGPGITGVQSEVRALPPAALSRVAISKRLHTGVKAIDALCPIGYGQRIGLIAPAGAGKTTLLGMIARGARTDLNVIALVGERGREVREFIDTALGAEGLKRSIVVVSTSDQSPLSRMYAALSATRIAEYFRDQGARVLLMVDSLTRFARAVRDLTLNCGELPVRHGFTPSVYNQLPILLERAGNNQCGSITAIFTLLCEDDHHGDPLAQEAKSLLDGHIVLDPRVAERGRRPAIDLTQSISRLSDILMSQAEKAQARTIRRAISRLQEEKELLLFGATPDAELARILAHEGDLENFLSQNSDQLVERSQTGALMQAVAKLLEQ